MAYVMPAVICEFSVSKYQQGFLYSAVYAGEKLLFFKEKLIISIFVGQFSLNFSNLSYTCASI